MVRLVAVDIDHTLTRPDGQVCDAAIIALRAARARGTHLALVSARPPEGVDSIADLIGADTYRVSYPGGRDTQSTKGRVAAADHGSGACLGDRPLR